MALTAVLEFGDNSIKRYSKQYLVADCQLVFNRPRNAFSPGGAARCERVDLEVIAPGKDDLGLFEWYSTQSVQNGRLVISFIGNGLNDADSQILYFEEAKCFSLSEDYDINSSRRRTLKLSICAEEINIEDVRFKSI